MKWTDRCGLAWNTLEKAAAMSKQIKILERLIERKESSAYRTTSHISQTFSRGTDTREDLLCDFIDLKPQLEKAKTEYNFYICNLDRNLMKIYNPKDELLLRMIYIYGADKSLVKAITGLSPSGFRYRFEQAVAAFDSVLKQESGNAA